jgi:hypothetical protein
MPEEKKQYPRLELRTNIPQPIELQFDEPRRFDGEYGVEFTYGVKTPENAAVQWRVKETFKIVSGDLLHEILAKYHKGDRLTITRIEQVTSSGFTAKPFKIEEGWPPAVTLESSVGQKAPENTKSVTPPVPESHPPPPIEEHPYAPSQGNGGKRPTFSEVVDLLHACFAAAGWILREEDEFDVTDDVRQAMTATLFIGCQKAGVQLTKDQAKLAVKHYTGAMAKEAV